jgi:hypothetical protein
MKRKPTFKVSDLPGTSGTSGTRPMGLGPADTMGSGITRVYIPVGYIPGVPSQCPATWSPERDWDLDYPSPTRSEGGAI